MGFVQYQNQSAHTEAVDEEKTPPAINLVFSPLTYIETSGTLINFTRKNYYCEIKDCFNRMKKNVKVLKRALYCHVQATLSSDIYRALG